MSWLGLGAADLGYAADGLDSEKIPFLHNRPLVLRAFHLSSNTLWCRRAYISLDRFSHSIFFHETRRAMPRLITSRYFHGTFEYDESAYKLFRHGGYSLCDMTSSATARLAVPLCTLECRPSNARWQSFLNTYILLLYSIRFRPGTLVPWASQYQPRSNLSLQIQLRVPLEYTPCFGSQGLISGDILYLLQRDSEPPCPTFSPFPQFTN